MKSGLSNERLVLATDHRQVHVAAQSGELFPPDPMDAFGNWHEFTTSAAVAPDKREWKA